MPNLRFPGFSGEWETKFLSDLMTFKNGINASKDDYGYGYKFINVLDIINNDFIDHNNITGSVNISENDYRKNIVEYGDILFQRSSETREDVGQANVYIDNDKTATFGGFVIRGKKNANYNPIYLNYLLKTSYARKEITSKSGGSTRYNVGQNTLSSVKIMLATLPEQNKIASLLIKIDQRISTQSQIIKNLQSLSKGMAQKLFSQQIHLNQNKESTPQLWNIIRLEELIIKTGRKNKDNIQYPIYSINNKEGFLPQNEQFEGVNSSDRGYDISLYKIVNKNTFAYNPARINVGSIGYSGSLDSIIISSLYVCFKTKKTLLDDYLLHYLRTYEFNKNVLRYSEGGVRQYLFFENLKKIKIPLPSLEEQQKIAKTLSSLDKKIEIETKLLEQLTNQKQYLLQNLFI